MEYSKFYYCYDWLLLPTKAVQTLTSSSRDQESDAALPYPRVQSFPPPER